MPDIDEPPAMSSAFNVVALDVNNAYRYAHLSPMVPISSISANSRWPFRMDLVDLQIEERRMHRPISPSSHGSRHGSKAQVRRRRQRSR
jgi:hypothetical protein